MKSDVNQTHKCCVWLIDNIVSSVKNNRRTINKDQLLEILEGHPETEEYLSYIQYCILLDCMDRDIITKDADNRIKFPIKRDKTGAVIRYHYIS